MRASFDRVQPRVALVAALSLTVLLFLSHVLATRAAFDDSLSGVDAIVRDALPSVIALSELRAVISQVRTEIAHSRISSDLDRQRLRHQLEGLLAAGNRHIREYKSVPPSAAEHELWPAFDAEAEAFRVAARASVDSARVDSDERLAFLTAATSFDEMASTLVESNAREAQTATRNIVQLHERAKARSFDFLLAISACVAALGVLGERWLARTEKETERLISELDAFSARVAHDLRGPLTPVALGLGLVKADPNLSESTRHSVEVAQVALRRAVALIDGLLEFARSGARPQPGARCEVARVAGDLAASSLRALAEQESAALEVDAPAGVHVATTDVVLSSIVSNLARNALLYLGESEKRLVAIRAREEAGWVWIEVSDTGPGIPPDVLARLFRPFERGSTRPGGHGLGLTTVKRLVEAHGGSIAVRSDVGLGTTFTVRLPRA